MTRKYDFNSGCYEDIINLPHHRSKTHPQMAIGNRAAQFSPFAALSGYEDALEETGRLTDTRAVLEEDAKAALDEKLRMMQEKIAAHPQVTVKYFVPDERKEGGAYKSVSGSVKKIDGYGNVLVMEEGVKIPLGEIVEIEGTIFGT